MDVNELLRQVIAEAKALKIPVSEYIAAGGNKPQGKDPIRLL